MTLSSYEDPLLCYKYSYGDPLLCKSTAARNSVMLQYIYSHTLFCNSTATGLLCWLQCCQTDNLVCYSTYNPVVLRQYTATVQGSSFSYSTATSALLRYIYVHTVQGSSALLEYSLQASSALLQYISTEEILCSAMVQLKGFFALLQYSPASRILYSATMRLQGVLCLVLCLATMQLHGPYAQLQCS